MLGRKLPEQMRVPVGILIELKPMAIADSLLFAIGAAITIFTGVTVWRSGSRQLALGLGAAGVTFVIGRLIGATLT